MGQIFTTKKPNRIKSVVHPSLNAKIVTIHSQIQPFINLLNLDPLLVPFDLRPTFAVIPRAELRVS